MKKISILNIIAVAVLMFVFTSCEKEEPFFNSSTFVEGDKTTTVPGDTITIVVPGDTIVVPGDTITIVVPGDSTTVDFKCYDFSNEGDIIAHMNNCTEKRKFSYNFQMDVVEEIYFKKERDSVSFKIVEEDAFFNKNNTATLKVSNGEEEVGVDVFVPGASSVIINSKTIFPCKYFVITGSLNNMPNKTVNEIEYFVAVVTCTFLNGDGEAVKSSDITLYSPVKKPVNKREVSITHSFDKDVLVIKGNITNTLLPDTSASVRIPLSLAIVGDSAKVVFGKDFKCSFESALSEVSTSTVNNFTKEDSSMVVTYNEYKKLYTHNVIASGNNVTNNVTVNYINNFVVNFGGQEKTFSFDLKTIACSHNEGKVCSKGEYAEKEISIPYKASLASLSSSVSQNITMKVKATYFDGEKIVWGNRSISFSSVLDKAQIFDCLLSEGKDGKYYYRYRQDGSANWTRLELSGEEEYYWLLEEAQKDYQGLANFYNVSDGSWLAGVVWSIDVKKAVSHASFGKDPMGKEGIALRTLIKAVQVDKAVLATLRPYEGNIFVMNGEYFIVALN